MLPDFDVRVTLKAGVAPSEDPARVMGALKQVVGDAPCTERNEGPFVRLESSGAASLERMHDQLRDRHVRAAAMKRLVHGRSGRKTTVMVNRQAATAGVIALCDSEEESPLGPVYLTIESDRLDELIQWLSDFPSA